MTDVSVVRFARTCAPYMTGDEAGFEPSIAELYVKGGFGVIIKANVPKVDQSIVVHDVQRHISEYAATLVGAEENAKRLGKQPGGAAAAAEIMQQVADTRRMLDALSAQAAAAPADAQLDNSKRPHASARAG